MGLSSTLAREESGRLELIVLSGHHSPSLDGEAEVQFKLIRSNALLSGVQLRFSRFVSIVHC